MPVLGLLVADARGREHYGPPAAATSIIAELEAALPELLMACDRHDRVLECATDKELESVQAGIDQWVRMNPNVNDPKKWIKHMLMTLMYEESQKRGGTSANVYGELARIAAYLGGPFLLRNSSGVVIYRSPAGISLIYTVIQCYHTVDLATYHRMVTG